MLQTCLPAGRCKARDFRGMRRISILVIIFAFFLAENSETQSRKHEGLKARNKTAFRLSCLRDQFFYLQIFWFRLVRVREFLTFIGVYLFEKFLPASLW
ncbi:MAG: hypothetical protein DRP28_01050 [Thermodesulfobacteriota bacterium]|nr:MAG: hypothetical protein DRP28_01050 [Thermodesulfobacteriota bacterium]